MYSLPGVIFWCCGVFPANATAPLFTSGHFFDGKLQRPFLAFSQDSGKSWEYPSSITPPLPNNFMDGELANTVCNKDLCITIGAFYTNEVTSTPLIVESRNKGSTWTWPDLLNNPTLPARFRDGWFKNATRTKTSCLVAGFYHDDDIGSKPLLAMKTNNSITWNYATINSPPNFQEGWFTDVACNNATCITVGTWSDAQNTSHPLLTASKDNGETWQTANLPD